MSILQVKNVSYTYPVSGSVHAAAINNISFSINKDETIGIIGHTGSGKSTLLQTLNGLIKPDCGTVFLNAGDIWENPKEIRSKRFKIGLVFQYPEYQLFEETVFDDIAFAPKNMGLSKNETEIRVKECASMLGLDESYLNKSPFELSGGEKRRVALAGILAMRPEILVLDEPTAGLDPAGRKLLYGAIKQYQNRQNAAVIIVSHSMEDLAALCDRLIVLESGQIKLSGTTEEVFSMPEVLNSMGLDVPQVTRVLLLLKEKGLNIKTNAFTPNQAAKIIIDYLSGEGNYAE